MNEQFNQKEDGFLEKWIFPIFELVIDLRYFIGLVAIMGLVAFLASSFMPRKNQPNPAVIADLGYDMAFRLANNMNNQEELQSPTVSEEVPNSAPEEVQPEMEDASESASEKPVNVDLIYEIESLNQISLLWLGNKSAQPSTQQVSLPEPDYSDFESTDHLDTPPFDGGESDAVGIDMFTQNVAQADKPITVDFNACDWTAPREIISLEDARTTAAALSNLGFLPGGHYNCDGPDWLPLMDAMDQFRYRMNNLDSDWSEVARVLEVQYYANNGCFQPLAEPMYVDRPEAQFVNESPYGDEFTEKGIVDGSSPVANDGAPDNDDDGTAKSQTQAKAKGKTTHSAASNSTESVKTDSSKPFDSKSMVVNEANFMGQYEAANNLRAIVDLNEQAIKKLSQENDGLNYQLAKSAISTNVLIDSLRQEIEYRNQFFEALETDFAECEVRERELILSIESLENEFVPALHRSIDEERGRVSNLVQYADSLMQVIDILEEDNDGLNNTIDLMIRSGYEKPVPPVNYSVPERRQFLTTDPPTADPKRKQEEPFKFPL